ncbi:hypothetical protein LI328DRAFT_70664 [Trichoderma asperelloides]|nr:hypothetical protein LI328DRAFT_70664 [Trichoderma asperelloides]
MVHLCLDSCLFLGPDHISDVSFNRRGALSQNTYCLLYDCTLLFQLLILNVKLFRRPILIVFLRLERVDNVLLPIIILFFFNKVSIFVISADSCRNSFNK